MPKVTKEKPETRRCSCGESFSDHVWTKFGNRECGNPQCRCMNYVPAGAPPLTYPPPVRTMGSSPW